MRVSRLVAAGFTAGAFLVLAVAQAPIASAHAQIVTSTPADGATLAASPSSVTLVMSEAVELRFTKLILTDGDGHQSPLAGVRVGPVPEGLLTSGASESDSGTGDSTEPEESPVAVTADLPPLRADIYRIAWSTLSSDDLHATSGVIVFGVQRTVLRQATTPSDPAPNAIESMLRWISLIGVGTAVGAAVLVLLLLRARRALGDPVLAVTARAVRRRLIVIAALGAATASVADVAALVWGVRDAQDPFTSALRLLDGSYGGRWAGRELAALGIVLACALAARGRRMDRDDSRAAYRAIVVAGAGYAVAVAITGHGAGTAARHPFRLAVESVHVLSAITWVGALVAAAVVLFRPVSSAPGRPHLSHAALALIRRAMLRRFGFVAAGCVAAMVVTGLLLAGERVASLDALAYSTYGRLLLLKLLLTVIGLSAAATTALRVHPDVVPLRALSRVMSLPLRVALTVEAIAALTVLAAAATLASAQPATGRIWSPSQPVIPLASATAGGLVETMQVAPNRPGRNFLTIDVFDSRRPAPGPISAVVVTLTGPDGQRNASAPAVDQGAGRWLVVTDAMSQPGAWRVALTVARTGLAPVDQSYRWVVTDPGLTTRQVVISDQPLKPVLDRAAGGLAAVSLLLALGVPVYRRGRRSRRSAPPSGAAAAQVSPPNAADTAATSARPRPVPGSSPRG
jgi:copper transport protein